MNWRCAVTDWKGEHIIRAVKPANAISLGQGIRAANERKKGINKGATKNPWKQRIRSSVIEAVRRG